MLYDLTWGNGLYIAVGTQGNMVSSSDAVTWTKQVLDTDNNLYSIAYGNNQFIAVGYNGTILSSPDGETWTPRASGTTDMLWRVAYGNGMFVAVSNLGGIYTSHDGSTWTRRDSGVGTSIFLRGVTYGKDQFVVTGANGVIITSPDGITWTSRASGTTQVLYDVTYGKNCFVIVGYSGTVLTSPDGISWTKRTSGTTLGLRGVAFGNNRYVITGQYNQFSSDPQVLTSEAPNIPEIISAVAGDESSRQAGIDSDDVVRIAFDRPFGTVPEINALTIDTTFILSGGHSWLSGFGTLAGTQWSDTKDTVTISLNTTGGVPTIAVGDTITYQGIPVILAGNFDPVPRIVSAIAGDSLIDIDGIDEDDFVKITFDSAFVSLPLLTSSTINSLFSLNDRHSWLSGTGSLTAVAWNSEKTEVTITLDTTGGLPSITAGDTITFNGERTIITGSFTSPLKIISAVASDNTIKMPGIDSDDYVILSFNKTPASIQEITSEVIDTLFRLSADHSWLSGAGVIADVQWNPWGNKVQIFFDASVSLPTVQVGDTIVFGGFAVELTGSFFELTTALAPSVKSRVSDQASSERVEVYSLQGKRLHTVKVLKNRNGAYTADYRNLPGGLYIIKESSRRFKVMRK